MDYSTRYLSIKITFLIINFLSIYIFYFFSKRISHCISYRKAWKNAYPIIFAYSISMGLRFGREIDYNLYYERYNEIGQDITKSTYEPVFNVICWSLNQVGIPYWVFIWLCSISIIYALMHLLINNYRPYTLYASLIFLFLAHDVELLIRYYLAFSFLILAFSYYKLKKNKISIILVILSFGCHVGMAPVILILICLMKVPKLILPAMVVQILFVINSLAGETGILSFLAPYVQLFGLIDDRAASYADSFTDIINGDFGKIGKHDTIIYTRVIRNILQYSVPIFLAPLLVKKKIIGFLEANIFYVGVILSPIFMQVEILNRISSSILFFSIIVSGASYVYVFNHKNEFKPWQINFCRVSVFASIWPVFSNILSRDTWWHMLYIWDAGNLDTLPLQYFLNELN